MSALGLAALDLGSNLINGLVGGGISYGYQKKLMNHQYELQNQMLDKVNAYNSPQQQLVRLRQAGMNPNLAYQSVNSVAGSTTPSIGGGSASVPSMRFNASQALMLEQQLREQSANADLRQEQVEAQRLENDRLRQEQPFWSSNAQLKNETLSWLTKRNEYSAKDAEINNTLNNLIAHAKLGIDGDFVGRDGTFLEGEGFKLSDTPLANYIVNDMLSKGISNDVAEKRMKYMDAQMDEIAARIVLMAKQGHNLDIRSELLGLEKIMKKSLGVSYSDGLGWRLLARFLGAIGVSPEDMSDLFNSDGLDPLDRGASVGGNP